MVPVGAGPHGMRAGPHWLPLSLGAWHRHVVPAGVPLQLLDFNHQLD